VGLIRLSRERFATYDAALGGGVAVFLLAAVLVGSVRGSDERSRPRPPAQGRGYRRSPCRSQTESREVGTMNYRSLGRTGVYVSPFGLGTMMFGKWGNRDHADCLRIVHRALDAGINLIDTADAYSDGESEDIVGAALQGGRRNQVVLATKANMPMGPGPNERGNSRRWLVLEVEASLRRLKTDWIDLYQIHRPAYDTDIDETLGALTDLVRQGKVRYIGSSTFPAARIVEAQWASRDGGLARFTCEQPPYSLLVREIESEILPTCQRHCMGVLVWSPLAGGWLSGAWRAAVHPPASRRAGLMPARFDVSTADGQRRLAATESLASLAEDCGLSLVHMALAFVIRHPGVTAALLGPRSMEHLESQLGAAEISLSDAVLDRIDAIVPPGSNAVATDVGWRNPDLAPEARRRPA
jgi:aryl-alcohol dehydrogenase-like predicted oxidoreductase